MQDVQTRILLTKITQTCLEIDSITRTTTDYNQLTIKPTHFIKGTLMQI